MSRANPLFACLYRLTVSNADGGNVVISHLGHGNARSAGLLVGDVITEINGVKVSTHEQAIDAMKKVTCRDLVFTLVGKLTQKVIDKYEAGKIEITLGNPKSGLGVSVETVGCMGLAFAAGLRAGDTIMSVNGVLVTDHASAIALSMPSSAAQTPCRRCPLATERPACSCVR